jgi:hypothetical protein
MSDNRRISEEYQQIADELINTRPEFEHIKESDATIICLASDCEKKNGKDRVVFGQCEKVADKYKWGIPCDFTITIFEPNVAGWDDERIKILIMHELHHVGIDEERFYIVKHDLEDFKAIVEEFGASWSDAE